MISREAFIDAMSAIERQYKRDEEVGKLITSIGDTQIMGGNNRFVYTTQLIEDLLNVLAKDTEDTQGDINYYVYETDFGAKADEFHLTLRNGRKVKFTDAGVLWDWLLENI